MKKIFCLLAVLMAGIAAFAQQPQTRAMLKDKKKIGEFTVQLKQSPGNTFLFDIVKEEGLPSLIPGTNNPVTMLPGGFATKDDAYKVAEWMIKQYKKHGHFPVVVPPHIARELNISIEKLYNHH